MTPLKGAKNLKELLNKATLLRLDSVGHFLTLENPLKLNELISNELMK